MSKLLQWTVSMFFILLAQSPAAFANRNFVCTKYRDGAFVHINDQVIGFSSVEQCKIQMKELSKGRPGTVICGCRAEDDSGNALETIFGSLVGVSRTVMYLECYRLEGASLLQTDQIPYSVIRETRNEKGKQQVYFNSEAFRSCRQQEARLFEDAKARF